MMGYLVYPVVHGFWLNEHSGASFRGWFTVLQKGALAKFLFKKCNCKLSKGPYTNNLDKQGEGAPNVYATT